MQPLLVSTQQCKLLETTPIVYGKYCPVNSVASLHSYPHHCRAMCLQADNCAAYNYNISDSSCTRLKAPCPLAQSDPVMMYGILITRTPEECWEWILFTRGDPRDERMVPEEEDLVRTVARTTNGGTNYFGYHHDTWDACFIATSTTTERINGPPCQRLRIAEGCTASWAPYTAGDPLPAQLVIGGKNANGDIAYVASLYNKCGYYIRGPVHGIVPFGNSGVVQAAAKMKLLVMV